MDNKLLWQLMQEVWQAIVPAYEPVFDRFCADAGLDHWTFGLLLAALTFEPESSTPAKLQVRGPYTAATAYLERLVFAAEKGYLVETAPETFHLTPWGQAEVERAVVDGRTAMAAADPLPLWAVQPLVRLLDRLIYASLETPPPPDTWSISLSLKLMPAEQPPLPYIEQAISCLFAYRDDAHLAAWQPSGLSATALEVLTLLWRGEADSLETVCRQLQRRGYPCRVYAKAFRELRQRGFLQGGDAAPRLTETGQAFREQVERDSDRYFFAPWGCLSEGEKGWLAEWLPRLRDCLRQVQLTVPSPM